MAIIVYNRQNEDHSSDPNNYPIYRGASVLGNPFTHKPLSKTLAVFQVKTREEAIERYDSYFDLQYENNEHFKGVIDEIYEKYKNGEDIYLECFCSPNPCHGNVIVKKLKKRLLKEKMKEAKKNKDATKRRK